MTGSQKRDVVVGAGSGIGCALIHRWIDLAARPVVAIARSPSSLEHFEPFDLVQTRVCDYSDEALASLVEGLRDDNVDIERLVICNGVLQGEGYRPERAVNQLDEHAMQRVFEVNTFLPMRVLAALTPLLKRSEAPRIAVLSARVGSIGDNRRGGWYTYRGSKAALNMMLKCAALELRRLNPSAKVLAYHPGTVDTPLSEPFQGSVDPSTLLSRERAAEALDKVLVETEPDGELSYLDWRGDVIPW